MLKVSNTLELDKDIGDASVAMLGDELELLKSSEIKKKEIIFPLLTKPRNDVGKKWGDNFYWGEGGSINMAKFNSNRNTNKCGSWQRKHAARDLYTLPRTAVVAICKGEVLRVDEFYAKTDQITILHKTDDGREFIIRYGELNPDGLEYNLKVMKDTTDIEILDDNNTKN